MCIDASCDTTGVAIGTTGTPFTFQDLITTASLTVQSTDPIVAGYSGATSRVYTIYVKAISDLYSANGITGETSFTVTIVDPCPDALLSSLTSTASWADYTYQVGTDSITILETNNLPTYFSS